MRNTIHTEPTGGVYTVNLPSRIIFPLASYQTNFIKTGIQISFEINGN